MKDHTGTIGGSPAGKRLDKVLCSLGNQEAISKISKLINKWGAKAQSIHDGIIEPRLNNEVLSLYKHIAIEQVDKVVDEVSCSKYPMASVEMLPEDAALINSLTKNVISLVFRKARKEVKGEQQCLMNH